MKSLKTWMLFLTLWGCDSGSPFKGRNGSPSTNKGVTSRNTDHQTSKSQEEPNSNQNIPKDPSDLPKVNHDAAPEGMLPVSPEACANSETWRIQKFEDNAMEIGVGLKSKCEQVEWSKYENYKDSNLIPILSLLTLPNSKEKEQELTKNHGFSCFLAGQSDTFQGKADFLWLFQNVKSEKICKNKCDFVISQNGNIAGRSITSSNSQKGTEGKCSFLGSPI